MSLYHWLTSNWSINHLYIVLEFQEQAYTLFLVSTLYSLYSVQDAKNILLNLSEKMGLQSKKHGRRFFFPLLSLIVMLLFSLSFLHYTINLPLSLSLNDIGPPNFFSFHSFLLPYPLSIMQLWCCYPFSYGSLLLYELYANRDQL